MGRDDLKSCQMDAAQRSELPFDVVCVGLAVGNVVVRPVPETILQVDTTQVEEIAMMGGGDAFNQACVLSALGNRTALVSRMADDESGRMMKAALTQRGIDTSLISTDETDGTSTCIVLIKKDGQRSFCTYKGCLKTFGAGDIDMSCVKRARVVSIGGLFALPSFDTQTSVALFRAAKQAGAITVADTKYDAFHIGLAGIGELLAYTDYFFPSYDEAAALSGLREPARIAAFFRARGAKHVGIKLGGDGCWLNCDSFVGSVPAFAARVVDTTGAGDNFMAGLIHGILRGWSFRDCALFANAAGALAVTRLGATSGLEYLAPIQEFLSTTADGVRLIREVMQ